MSCICVAHECKHKEEFLEFVAPLVHVRLNLACLQQIRVGRFDKVADVERGYTSWQQPAEGKLRTMNQGQICI